MTAHQPKTSALLAYRAQRLSETGRTRLERHLDQCEQCRRALATMTLYDDLAEDVREAPTPAVDFDRMELELAREARKQARIQRRRPVVSRTVAGVALAAAALLAVMSTLLDDGAQQATVDPPAPTSDRPRAESSEAEHAAMRRGEVTAVSGKVTAHRPNGERTSVTIGMELGERTRLVTGPHGRVDVRLREATGISVHPDTALELKHLRSARVRLALQSGAVSNAVAPLGSEQRYVVASDPWEAHVVGTRFTVRREPDGGPLGVAVREGSVEVRRGAEAVRTLEASSQWHSDDEGEELVVRRPQALTEEAGGWPVLRLPEVEGVTRWGIERDGESVEWSAAGTLAMRVPAGELPVRAIGRQGRSHRVVIPVEPDGGGLSEAQLRRVRGRLSAAAQGHLAPEAIEKTINEAQPALQRCHERLLRRRPDLGGIYSLRLRVRVGRSGVVQRVSVTDRQDDPPAPLLDCIRQKLTRHAFPKPTGGPVTFEVPLQFSTSQ